MKNPKAAIALRYDGVNAPQVSAKGYDALAEKLIEEMEKNGGLVHSDEALMNWLSALEIGDEVPESVYLVIAELIAFAWYLDGQTPPGWEGSVVNQSV
ncbi:EscU/YscU/HrcU family type III secretion system export apparatus switch protein [Enterovibrio sp. ZSDZ42]|uniref:EscU/YscU/HrcU family type III secretion system export apparatus switch protein n=1 Tax=Enterovibrio gelatinilyticus TaxID=2899819 RepID=A0ABT5QY22_9GAMM|nr:EscU/YscU/HrcU family type III secretion system export apparatus switch protein [Enterovibrio sp. ZSDZ42]MDD1792431.1 EscU/YscU/HrcU family type III secretion system export apparatus switch protein [Enterovibrio sp. ZSDZ42]